MRWKCNKTDAPHPETNKSLPNGVKMLFQISAAVKANFICKWKLPGREGVCFEERIAYPLHSCSIGRGRGQGRDANQQGAVERS